MTAMPATKQAALNVGRTMKTTLLLLSITAAMLLLYATVQHLNIRGSERLLNSIQTVRNGKSKEKVEELMGRDGIVYPANSLPEWLKEVVPEKETGEYRVFFMG
jgi:hypothetical protein